jgi:hypothetical protein
MNMKDRVDNFLKVSEERMNNDVHDRELQSHLVDLCGELTQLIKDPEEQNRLHDGFVKAQANARIAAWDERFLKVISQEDTRSEMEKRMSDLTSQVTQGRMKQRMGVTTHNGTLAQNAVWTNNNATLEKELQELKDEIRANRYKTP